MLLYHADKPRLSDLDRLKSKKLYDYAYRGDLEKMIEILENDTVGIADYRFGGPHGPTATTLTIYLMACMRKNKDALAGTKLLVEHGANVLTRLVHWDTAMSLAVRWDFVEVVRYLIEKGGAIEFYEFNSREMMKLFITSGFDIRSRNSDGRTILHYTVGSGIKSHELRHFLVAQGCDINALCYRGESVLHDYARDGTPESTLDLCRMGARLDIENSYGETPLRVATGENKRILEQEPLRRLAITNALAVGFGGNHQRDPLKARLLPEERELMQMVLDYLPGAPLH